MWFLFAACAVPAPDPVDYDATCDVAADCVAVNAEPRCGCDCAALSLEGAEAYEADVADWLEGRSVCPLLCLCDDAPACDDGTCTLR